MFLSLVSFYLKKHIQRDESSVVADYFGFKTNGKFNITLTTTSSNQILLQMCHSKEYHKLVNSNKPAQNCVHFSKICAKSAFRLPENGTVFYTGTINKTDKTGRYYSIITNCDGSKSNHTLELTLRNKKSHLSSEHIPCIITNPIFFIITMCLIGHAIGAFALRVKVHCTLSIFLIITDLFAVFYTLFSACYHFHHDESDTSWGIIEYYQTFKIIYQIMLTATLLFISRGYQIIHPYYEKYQIFQTLFSSAAVCVTLACYELNDSLTYHFLILLIFIIAFAYLIYTMITSVNDSILHIYAHMYVIAETGINPMTTPVPSKLKLYKIITYIIISYFSIQLLSMIIGSFFEVSFWIIQLIQYSSDFLMMVGICHVFKPPLLKTAGYQTLDESNYIEEFTKEEIQSLDLMAFLETATKQWDKVSTLPAPPKIVKTKSVSMPQDILEPLENNNQQESDIIITNIDAEL